MDTASTKAQILISKSISAEPVARWTAEAAHNGELKISGATWQEASDDLAEILIRLGKIKLYVLNVGINLHIWVGGRPRLELIQKNQYF